MYPNLTIVTHIEKRMVLVRGSLIQPSNSLYNRSTSEEIPTGFPKRQHIVELLIVGSNANNGSQCGLSYANSNNAFGNSNDNIGARLKFNTIKRYGDAVHKVRTGHTIEPVSMEGTQKVSPDRAKMKGIGYEG